MNKQRRKVIADIQAQLSNLAEAINNVWSEEQEAFDNLPEGLQESERGEAMQEAIDALESAADLCEELDDALNEALGQ